MLETADHVSHMAHPVVQALATVDAVIGIVCFGSYALGTTDAESDLDLYVICHPLIVPEAIRRSRFEAIPGVSEIHLHYETLGWDNAWAPQSDRVTVEPLVFDLSYTTHAWLTPVVHRVLTEGALTLPEMAFRPYTLCGLLAQAIPLYDPHGMVDGLIAQLSPYPAALKANLIREALPLMRDGLMELRDYTRRNIGPGAFLFHLGQVCEAMVAILYALNEHYDPATKRPEQGLSKLAVVPDRFVERFIRLLEGPFDPQGRQCVVDELAILVEEVTQLAPRAGLTTRCRPTGTRPSVSRP